MFIMGELLQDLRFYINHFNEFLIPVIVACLLGLWVWKKVEEKEYDYGVFIAFVNTLIIFGYAILKFDVKADMSFAIATALFVTAIHVSFQSFLILEALSQKKDIFPMLYTTYMQALASFVGAVLIKLFVEDSPILFRIMFLIILAFVFAGARYPTYMEEKEKLEREIQNTVEELETTKTSPQKSLYLPEKVKNELEAEKRVREIVAELKLENLIEERLQYDLTDEELEALLEAILKLEDPEKKKELIQKVIEVKEEEAFEEGYSLGKLSGKMSGFGSGYAAGSGI